nr:glycosyltransferase family 4 protein [uncultured Mucilaginibacter sp.]
MKIVILNNDFRVYWKGRLIYLRDYLGAENIQLNAIELFGKGSPYEFDTFNSNNSWWACLYPDKAAGDMPGGQLKAKLFAALDKISPDVVIGPSIVFFAGALGISWAKKNKKKFIMFDDARPTQVKRNAVVQWVKNLITSHADGFWLPSKSYDAAYAHFKQQGVHFFYGFACIDNKLFMADRGAEAARKTIICVARQVPIKNIDGLLNAWYVVEQQHTGYELQIVGSGPEVHNLHQQKIRLGLKTAQFIDAVDNNKLPQHFAGAEAFILPSFSETWGLVVNEAMAAGLPVLLSRTVNAANDLLIEGENGFSFDAFDTPDMASTILKYIYLDKAGKKLMSKRSLAIIDNMSYEKMGEQLTEGLTLITNRPYKKPGIIADAIISVWHGRYNTSGWDKL